jgi:hypothetical protein
MNLSEKSEHSASDTNLFLALGKYVRRQNENLLTQSFSAILNHSKACQQSFLKLAFKNKYLNAEAFSAHTQIVNRLKNKKRIIVDIELQDAGKTFALVEAKLEAILPEKQAKNYAEILNSRAKGLELILITKYGVDPYLLKLLGRKAVWLTWSQVGEVMSSCRRLSMVDNYLIKEFLNMLSHIGIQRIEALTKNSWNRLHLISNFISSHSDEERLHYDHIETIQKIFNRLIVFRDASWSGLANSGWTPYAEMYAYRSKDGDPETNICTGYYHKGSKASVNYKWIQLLISCERRRMEICGGWKPKKSRQEYDDDWYEEIGHWTPVESFNFMKIETHDACAKICEKMHSALQIFKKSKYYNA